MNATGPGYPHIIDYSAILHSLIHSSATPVANHTNVRHFASPTPFFQQRDQYRLSRPLHDVFKASHLYPPTLPSFGTAHITIYFPMALLHLDRHAMSRDPPEDLLAHDVTQVEHRVK